MRKLFSRHTLIVVGVVIGAMTFAAAAYADEGYRGCEQDTECPYDGMEFGGLCSFHDDGGNGACWCNEIAAPYGHYGTCACSTHEYPPCVQEE
jgi:hypothetical protein